MRTFKYPTVLLVISFTVLLVVTLVILLYFNKSRDTQTTITTPDTPLVATPQVASGFTSPTGIAATTSDNRLYVVEQAGTVHSAAPSNQTEPQLFMDIQDKVFSDGEMGLIGLVFHPDYSQNGFIFVNYINKAQNTVIARYHAQNNMVDSASEKVVLSFKQPYGNHNGGDLAFGPDGYLYVALGDGGQAGDPDDRAQDKSSFLGKLLRIDINTDEPYTVPDTNPFVGEPNVKPEIWAYGLRNPWRISFDSQTGDLYIADVGQASLEEVDFQPANSRGGENYGWRCYEGTKEYNLEGCDATANYVAPVVEYSHEDNRCSITGGYVYRGEAQPALQGKYFYGDFCGEQLYYAARSDGKWSQTLALQTTFAISAFGEASDGELYFVDYNTGNMYKIEATSAE
jgi:glucose/arabinose dehydrogenase